MLNLRKIKLNIGTVRPIRVLHFTDAHLTFANDADGAEMQIHARSRGDAFKKEADFPQKSPEEYLREALELSESYDAAVVTGDVLDFTSIENKRVAKEMFRDFDGMCCAGNHEFCPMVGIPDSFERMRKTYGDIRNVFGKDIFFDSRVAGGVNLIAVDNSCFVWTEEQRKRFLKEFEKGYPCLVFCHTPILEANLWHNPSHHDLAVTEKEAEFTRGVTEMLIDEPLVKAFFAGHYHINGEQTLENGKICYVTGGLFKGIATEIEIL